MSEATAILKNINNIILAAPANMISGGPELLHQLCHTLRSIGKNAFIAYYNVNGCAERISAPIPAPYEKYDVALLSDPTLFQEESSLLIICEGAIPLYFHYPNCKKCIWWLSVDNYLSAYQNEITSSPTGHPDAFHLKEKEECLHLVQSEYARQFLLNDMEIPPERMDYLSDYLNSEFFRIQIPAQFKQNFIAFNPKKGFDKLKPIIDATPQFTWMPIINMTAQDVGNLLRLSKVYVDFGNHPGKDRIPREAAISGCCVLTNKEGSAAFFEDVPIPEDYKFENIPESQDEIIQLIADIFENYEIHSQNFSFYRDKILSEEEQFVADVKRLFL